MLVSILLWLLGGLLLLTLVIAAGLMAEAQADDYGCQVLLCLSNPSGPMAVAQCEPPIQRFIREQAEQPPKPFPQCSEANGQAVAQRGTNPYDACPEGTTALAEGVEVMQGMPPQAPGRYPYSFGTLVNPDSSVVLYTGIGDGEGKTRASGKKVCVGKVLGSVNLVYTQGSGDASSMTTKTVQVFDSVSTMDPAKGSPMYVDVFINGKQYRRVRF